MEDQQGKRALEQHCMPTRPNRHQWNLCPTTEEYIFFPSTQGTFFKIDQMLGNKISLKFKNSKLIQHMFSKATTE